MRFFRIEQDGLSLHGTLRYGPFATLQPDIMGPFRFLRKYRLATYRGAKIEEWSSSGAVIRQGEYRLEAKLLNREWQALRAPVEGRMERTIHESLCAEVRYRFWRGKDVLLQHTNRYGSFEYSSVN